MWSVPVIRFYIRDVRFLAERGTKAYSTMMESVDNPPVIHSAFEALMAALKLLVRAVNACLKGVSVDKIFDGRPLLSQAEKMAVEFIEWTTQNHRKKLDGNEPEEDCVFMRISLKGTLVDNNMSRTPTDNRSGTSTDNRSRTPTDKRSKTPTDDRSRTPTDDRSRTPTDDRSRTPTDDRSRTPSVVGEFLECAPSQGVPQLRPGQSEECLQPHPEGLLVTSSLESSPRPQLQEANLHPQGDALHPLLPQPDPGASCRETPRKAEQAGQQAQEDGSGEQPRDRAGGWSL
ncbi:hypothetical protein ACOMHN_065829 [Nucella lapillus]